MRPGGGDRLCPDAAGDELASKWCLRACGLRAVDAATGNGPTEPRIVPACPVMKILLIGNPVSGRGRAVARISALVRMLRSAGHKVDLYMTGAGGQARLRAAALDPDVAVLVVAGGDGTFNEVVSGLADPSQVRLALLPAGSANVLARELKLPWRPEAVCALVAGGRVRHLDLGTAGRRCFCMMASSGIDAQIVDQVHRSRKGVLGMHKYVWPALGVIGRWKTPHLKVTVDGTEAHGAVVVVANTRTYGGLFWAADRAEVDSGYLDVVVLPRDSLWAVVRYLWAGWHHRLSRLGEVTYLRGTRIRIEADRPVPVQLDGDLAGTTPVTMSVRPRCLPVLVPGR